MSDGSVAVALPNFGDDTRPVDVCLSAVGLGAAGDVKVRDIWRRRDLGVIPRGQRFSANVSSHDTVLVRLVPLSAS